MNSLNRVNIQPNGIKLAGIRIGYGYMDNVLIGGYTNGMFGKCTVWNPYVPVASGLECIGTGLSLYKAFGKLVNRKKNNGYYMSTRSVHIESIDRVMKNHENMNLVELVKASKYVRIGGKHNRQLQDLIAKRGCSELKDVKNAKELSIILSAFDNPTVHFYPFYAHVVNEIMTRKLFPVDAQMWINYFRFLGNNNVFHRELFDMLSDLYFSYLEKIIQSNPTREAFETMALCPRAFAICAPTVGYSELFDLIIKVKDQIKDHKVVQRILWALAVKDYGLDSINVDVFEKFLDGSLHNDRNRKRSVYQTYTTLLAMKNKGIDVSRVIERCKEILNDMEYREQFNKVSKSQRYASDVLARLGVPHKLEIITNSFLSIDIAILGDSEKIAIEVDGPYHYILDCKTMDTSARSGQTLFKERLLKQDGWTFISIPPITLDGRADVELFKLDEVYRDVLLNSGSEYLKRLLC